MLTVQRDDVIEIVNKRAIRLREQIIPVERLACILKLSQDASPEKDEVMIVIIRNGEEKLGLIVDEILGREEMVVKPLPPRPPESADGLGSYCRGAEQHHQCPPYPRAVKPGA
ncbi:chemotaxis protein CheW [Geobacter sp. OR-1]|uniref:chemotaxis protein CheW n=1 Tax=Geobacter sp. OR-1 TaxID=1266765 RepID=UPI001ED9ACB1|nr:chemotaxis protein CheW [Geobacter sp. OR-1]